MEIEYIEEVELEKFNPYHDAKGRFTHAAGATSFTIRTRGGAYQQEMVDRAIERERRRNTDMIDEIFEVPPRYEKAKNMDDAVSLARTLTKDGAFTVKGLHLNTVNAFNEAMFNVKQMFGNKLDIKGIKSMKNGDARYQQGAYNPFTHEVSIQGGMSSNAMAAHEKRAKKLFENGWSASKDPLGTFYHEIAHSIWYELPKEARTQITDIFKREKREAYEKWIDAGGSNSGMSQREFFGKKLSQYAAEDEKEFFSEAFSQIMSKRQRPVSREVNKILSEHYKKGARVSV